MSQVYVISDTHWNHANIIDLANRPFDNVEEMNEVMIQNWNSTVKKRDTVYHMGDVGFIDGPAYNRLTGTKYLIAGNHDKWNTIRLFERVYGVVVKNVNNRRVVLTHTPIHPDEFYSWEYNLHGHTHEKKMRMAKWPDIEDTRYINCCVEHWDYTPTPIEEVIATHKRNII